MFFWGFLFFTATSIALSAPPPIDFSLAEKDFPFVDAWLGEFCDELGEAILSGEPARFQYLKKGDAKIGSKHTDAWRFYTTEAKFFEANAAFLKDGRPLTDAGKLTGGSNRHVTRMNDLPPKPAHPRTHHAVWQAPGGRKRLFLINVSWGDDKWIWTGHVKCFSGELRPRSFMAIPLEDGPDWVDVGSLKALKAKTGAQYPHTVLKLDKADWILDSVRTDPYGVTRWVIDLVRPHETTCVLASVGEPKKSS